MVNPRRKRGAAPAQKGPRLHLSILYLSLIRIVGITGIVPIVTVGYGIPVVSRPPRLDCCAILWAKWDELAALIAKTTTSRALRGNKRAAPPRQQDPANPGRGSGHPETLSRASPFAPHVCGHFLTPAGQPRFRPLLGFTPAFVHAMFRHCMQPLVVFGQP